MAADPAEFNERNQRLKKIHWKKNKEPLKVPFFSYKNTSQAAQQVSCVMFYDLATYLGKTIGLLPEGTKGT
jgi:hypothetical protein